MHGPMMTGCWTCDVRAGDNIVGMVFEAPEKDQSMGMNTGTKRKTGEIGRGEWWGRVVGDGGGEEGRGALH